MSAFERCEKCKQYVWVDRHKCKPFGVYQPEWYGEEWETKYGLSEEDVVEQLASNYNNDDPVFEEDIFESPIIIKNEEGEETSYNCTASVSIDYYVTEIKEVTNENKSK